MLTLLQNQSATLEYYPSKRCSSVSVTTYKPTGGELVASAAATVDATSTTIDGAPTSNSVFAVASASGLVVGRKYVIESATEGSSVVEIAEISGTTVTLTDPASLDLASGDAFRGLRVTADLPSSATSERGLHFRADWLCTPADGTDVSGGRTMFAISRMQFAPPVTRDDVSRHLAYQFPSARARYTGEEMANVADRASTMVTRLVESTGRAPDLVGRSDAFKDAGLHALRLALSDDGLIPQSGVIDLIEYQDALRRSLAASVRESINALQWYDDDDDGVVDQNRLEVGPYSIRVVL